MVDVDEAELNKPTFKPDCKLLGDAGEFLRLANATWRYGTVHGEWLDYCNKVKKMYPVDLEVIDIEEGTGINQNKVGALVVNYKGYKVKVGSGLTKEQRELWWNNPNLILGKIITVQYFEETTNKKDDSLSLRFPVLKEVRNDKTEESYN